MVCEYNDVSQPWWFAKSHVWLFAAPWTVGSSVHGILQARIWSGLPFPSPGDLPDPGIELGSPAPLADSLPTKLPGKPRYMYFPSVLSLPSTPATPLNPSRLSQNPGLSSLCYIATSNEDFAFNWTLCSISAIPLRSCLMKFHHYLFIIAVILPMPKWLPYCKLDILEDVLILSILHIST